MSLSEERAISCPRCSQVGAVRVHVSVNATLDPALKTELLEGTLFRFECPKCGNVARIVDPHFVYHDTAKGFLIQVDTLGDFDTAGALKAFGDALPKTTRVVRDGNALLEKVKVFDAGLDDRVVEALKVVARSTQAPGRGQESRYLFEAVETQGTASRLRFTLLAKDGSIVALAAPRDMYDGLARKLETDGRLVDPGPFAVVDEAFAHLLLGG